MSTSIPKSDLVNALSQNITANFHCGEIVSDLHCAKPCRASAALYECLMKFIVIGNQNEEKDIAKLVRNVAVKCRDECSGRENSHCQECVKANNKLIQALDRYYSF